MSHLIHQIKINLKDNRTLHKMSNSLEEKTLFIYLDVAPASDFRGQ